MVNTMKFAIKTAIDTAIIWLFLMVLMPEIFISSSEAISPIISILYILALSVVLNIGEVLLKVQ